MLRGLFSIRDKVPTSLSTQIETSLNLQLQMYTYVQQCAIGSNSSGSSSSRSSSKRRRRRSRRSSSSRVTNKVKIPQSVSFVATVTMQITTKSQVNRKPELKIF